MHYFPDILAMLCLFASGIVYGFYFKTVEMLISQSTRSWSHWHALTAVGCCIAVASMLTVKKVRDRRYEYDHFYIMFVGIVCFLISGCFLLDENSNASIYFGLAGHGIMHVPAYTYISIRSSTFEYRPSRIALANTLYFSGVATGFSTFLELNLGTLQTIGYHENGWTLLGIAIALLAGMALNEVFHLTKAYNYKKSRDVDWNYCNDHEVLFHNEQSLRKEAQRGEWSQFVVGPSKQKTVVIFMFFTYLERVVMFSLVMLGVGITAGMHSTDNLNYYAPFVFYAVGCALGCFLLVWFQSKNVQLLFGLVKISATIAILVLFDESRIANCYPFVCVYFLSMGVYSSVPVQGILETVPLKYTELIFGFAYVFEFGLIEVLKYEVMAVYLHGLRSVLLADGIWFSTMALVCIILVQMYCPKSESLIEMRNKLIGFRCANFIPRPRVWNTNWVYGNATPQSAANITTVTLDGNRIYQQYTPN